MAKTQKRKMRTDYSDMTTAEIARLPILQGPENDYGELDVYAVDIPADEGLVKTRMGYKCRCDGCGKEFKTLYVSTHYFYTIDGWDPLSYQECKRCAKLDIKSKTKRIIRRIKKAIRYCIIQRRICGVGGEYWEAFYANARRRTGPLDDFDKEALLRVKRFVKKAKKNGDKPYMTNKEYAKIVRFANECQGGW